ncbi:MAG: PDZ domain-containing protein, partial [Acidimicrobiia bacterium]|nr:PDZ domain-containing protein [Acidimicrobiia bacterium]
WPFVVVGLLLSVGALAFLIYPLNTGYVAFLPGTVEDVADYVVIDSASAEVYEPFGDLYFLTVLSDEVNVFEYIEAVFDDEVDLLDRDHVRPPDISREEYTRLNLASMEESVQAATFVALTRLGYEPTFDGGGALVTATVDDSPAQDVFESGVDIIVAVDGQEVRLAEDAVELVGAHGPGETIVLTVEREDGSTDDVEIILIPNPDDATKGLVGVFLATAELDIDFPVDVAIETGNIGGPSAGMMYALGIFNYLTPDDITKGHRVAGTGEIHFDGEVGAIGGVRQKIFAAKAAGAEYVLVPTNNYEDAQEAADGDIEIVAVATVDDALDFLETLDPVPQLQAQSG